MTPQPHFDPDVFFLPLAVKNPAKLEGLSPWVLARRIPDFLHQVINQGESGPTGMLEVQTPPDGEQPVEWVRMVEMVPADEAFAMLPPTAKVRAILTGSLELCEGRLAIEMVVHMREADDEPAGEARVQIFPRENLQDTDALERFVLALREIDPYVSGVSVNLFDFGRATVSSFQQAIALAFVLISLLLYGLWRNWADVALVLAPLLLGAIVTVAAMAALGIHFTFANVIVLPLLFGIGVDSGVHLVHRAKIRLKGDEFLMGTTTARAVFYSALTTVASFGTLAFSSHRGVAGLGVLLTIGMLLMVVCNLIVLPALIELQAEEPE